ncbi:hypothetical protein F3X92_25495, partial [Salmonella enterica]|nr:hypothetical protein [Salmonella enterica]
MKPTFTAWTALAWAAAICGTTSAWGGALDGGTVDKAESIAVGKDAHAIKQSVAIGANADAANADQVAIGFRANTTAGFGIAIGAAAQSSDGTGSVAIGGAASASQNGVALGYGSLTTRAREVSIGREGQTRTLSNLADGTEDTDAVNKRQLDEMGKAALHGASTYTDIGIADLDKKAQVYAGSAKDQAIAGANKHTDTEITTLDGKAQDYAKTAKNDAV